MLMDVIRGSISADSLCTVCSHCLLNLRSCWLSMQLDIHIQERRYPVTAVFGDVVVEEDGKDQPERYENK